MTDHDTRYLTRGFTPAITPVTVCNEGDNTVTVLLPDGIRAKYRRDDEWNRLHRTAYEAKKHLLSILGNHLKTLVEGAAEVKASIRAVKKLGGCRA